MLGDSHLSKEKIPFGSHKGVTIDHYFLTISTQRMLKKE
jgi:hypothetical protein